MPISEDGTPIQHSGSWFSCVSSNSNTESVIGAVRQILANDEIMTFIQRDFFCDHINVLADVRDAEDRTALSLAAKGPRAELNKYLLFCCGRYELY